MYDLAPIAPLGNEIDPAAQSDGDATETPVSRQ